MMSFKIGNFANATLKTEKHLIQEMQVVSRKWKNKRVDSPSKTPGRKTVLPTP